MDGFLSDQKAIPLLSGKRAGTCARNQEREKEVYFLLAANVPVCLHHAQGDEMNDEQAAKAQARTTEHPRKGRVIADYQALYPDPIALSAGESLTLSEQVESWRGNPQWIWIWCTDQRGKSGWVPKATIAFHATGTTGTVRSAYAATELTVAVGDALLIEREESGWLWCTNQEGKSGWRS